MSELKRHTYSTPHRYGVARGRKIQGCGYGVESPSASRLVAQGRRARNPETPVQVGPGRGGNYAMELKRHPYATDEFAVQFFRDARAQGFSPSLVEAPNGWDVVIY